MKLNVESITEQVRHLLRGEIEAGRLTPGTRIREEAFAAKLGISKSPLRLALHQLKQEGIIRIEPRKGFYVAVPSNEQVLSLMEMRAVLEGLAARLAAARADKGFVKRLERCFAGFREEELSARHREYSIADTRFQRLLAEASGNLELVDSLERINIRLNMSRLYADLMADHDLVPVHREHLAIIAAIKSGDGDQAEELTRAHVTSVRKLALQKSTHDRPGDDLQPVQVSA